MILPKKIFTGFGGEAWYFFLHVEGKCGLQLKQIFLFLFWREKEVDNLAECYTMCCVYASGMADGA